MVINDLELDDVIMALKVICKETRMKANEKYLGTGELDLSDDHPSKTKSDVKKSIRDKYEYLV